MRQSRHTLSENIRARSITLLSSGLVHALDLERQAKQAHWNLRGPGFLSLHELFDKVSDASRDYADLCAERLVALGGEADGRPRTVADTSMLPEYPLGVSHTGDHVDRLADAISAFASLSREAVDQATAWGDAITADVFTEIGRGLDQQLWMVEAHLPASSS